MPNSTLFKAYIRESAMSDSSGGVNGPGSPRINDTTNTSLSSTTSAWAAGAGMAGSAKRLRSFAEIIADQRQNRNILELSFTKIPHVDPSGNTRKIPKSNI